MAHEVETAAYAFTPAWHSRGVVVDHAMTSKEAILAAGLDWEVFVDDLTTADGTKSNLKVIRRRDTGAVIGEGVTADYVPFQNWDGFSFLDGLVPEFGLTYESAMSLRGGSEICLLARMPGNMVISKGKTKAGEKRGAFRDIVEKYLFLRSGHDGKTSCLIIPTSTRVVCANTSRMAVAGATDWLHITHTGNLDVQLAKAREALMSADQAFKNWEAQAKEMAAITLKDDDRDEMLETWLDVNFGWNADGQILNYDGSIREDAPETSLLDAIVEKSAAKAEKQKERRIGKYTDTLSMILANTEDAVHNPVVDTKSAWCLYNAVTQYVDHDKKYNFRGDDVSRDEKKLASVLYGEGAIYKDLAWDLCRKAAGLQLEAYVPPMNVQNLMA